jgi:hypothetical protein
MTGFNRIHHFCPGSDTNMALLVYNYKKLSKR